MRPQLPTHKGSNAPSYYGEQRGVKSQANPPSTSTLSWIRSKRYSRLFDRYMETRPGSEAARILLRELLETPTC